MHVKSFEIVIKLVKLVALDDVRLDAKRSGVYATFPRLLFSALHYMIYFCYAAPIAVL